MPSFLDVIANICLSLHHYPPIGYIDLAQHGDKVKIYRYLSGDLPGGEPAVLRVRFLEKYLPLQELYLPQVRPPGNS